MVDDDRQRKILQFFVRDTGIGIAPEHQALIFEPFRQTHSTCESHALGGTGLGLAIARRLAELMGGKLYLESRLGHGSTFYLTVPYIPATNVTISPASGQHLTRVISQASVHMGSLSGKILLVDDNKVNLKLAERVILRMGCNSIKACNGRNAVDIFRRDPSISLILMDKGKF